MKARTILLPTDSILTPTETRIAIGYVEGYIGKEIANRHNVSYNTVVRHTQNIYDKTGIRRTTNALVAWFLARNFDLNIADISRRLGAALLLLLICSYTITVHNEDFIRTSRTRTSNSRMRTASRRGRNEYDIDYI